MKQTLHGIRYPESKDGVEIDEAFQNIAQDIDPQLNVVTVQYYTADDTWTKPNSLKYVVIEAVGGGGAGGGSQACSSVQTAMGSGGTGGWYSKSRILANALASTETVTVGTGGSGNTGADGDDGVASSFGTHVIAPPGQGAIEHGPSTSNNFFGGPVPTGTGTGDITFPGEPGGGGFLTSNFNTCQGGIGGGSFYGAGGFVGPNGSPGNPGELYGGGGSGGSTRKSGSATAGGDGAAGIVIVWEYY